MLLYWPRMRIVDFHNHYYPPEYVDALKKLVEKKAKSKGKKVLEDVEEPATGGKSNVIDLMAALKQSVGGKEKVKPAAKEPAKAPAKSAAKTRKRA